MEITWEGTKEVFFALGSVAGFLSLFKPVLQQKYDLDAERFRSLRNQLTDDLFLNLEYSTWNSRLIRSSLFDPLDKLSFEVSRNLESVRFSGPLAKWYLTEVQAIVTAYGAYREYVQVPEWEPCERNEDGVKVRYWQFNKRAYEKTPGVPSDYAADLSNATKLVKKMHLHIKRLQVISEMHVIEAPFAKIVLPRRLKALKSEKT